MYNYKNALILERNKGYFEAFDMMGKFICMGETLAECKSKIL